jgi:hypothetical protein
MSNSRRARGLARAQPGSTSNQLNGAVAVANGTCSACPPMKDSTR